MSFSRTKFILGTASVATAAAAATPVKIAASVAASPLSNVAASTKSSSVVDALRAVSIVTSTRPRPAGAKGACGEHYFALRDLVGEAHAGGFPDWAGVVFDPSETPTRLAAVPMHCGGTAGATVVAVIEHSSDGTRYVGAIRQGHKQRAFFKDGSLQIATPKWAPGEPNACWSETRVGRYSLEDGAIKLVSQHVMPTTKFVENHRFLFKVCQA